MHTCSKEHAGVMWKVALQVNDWYILQNTVILLGAPYFTLISRWDNTDKEITGNHQRCGKPCSQNLAIRERRKQASIHQSSSGFTSAALQKARGISCTWKFTLLYFEGFLYDWLRNIMVSIHHQRSLLSWVQRLVG